MVKKTYIALNLYMFKILKKKNIHTPIQYKKRMQKIYILLHIYIKDECSSCICWRQTRGLIHNFYVCQNPHNPTTSIQTSL